MFYVKAQLGEGAEIRVKVTSDNVFNICPRCGCETAVDLHDILADGGGDLYGTSVYCPTCAAERQEQE